MSTETDQENLVMLLYGELPPEEAELVRQRMQSDPALQQQWADWRRTRQALAHWQDERPPEHLHERIMTQVRSWEVRRNNRQAWWNWLGAHGSPALLGTLTALVAVCLLLSGEPVARMDPRWLMACGVVWGGMYSSLFGLMFAPAGGRARTGARLSLPAAVRWGFGAFLMALAVAMITPNPFPFEDRPYMYSLAARLPEWVAAYIPLWLTVAGVGGAGVLAGLLSPGLAWRQGLWLGVTYLVLMLLDLATCMMLYTEVSVWHMLLWTLTIIPAGLVLGPAAVWLGGRLRHGLTPG